MYQWRKYVEDKPILGIQLKSPVTVELLNELENHYDLPAREPGETKQAVLGNWLVGALAAGKLTIPEFELLRRRLKLEGEIPAVHTNMKQELEDIPKESPTST